MVDGLPPRPVLSAAVCTAHRAMGFWLSSTAAATGALPRVDNAVLVPLLKGKASPPEDGGGMAA